MKMRMKMKNNHIDTTKIDLGPDMDNNIVNIKNVSLSGLLICIKQHLNNI